MSHKLYIYSVTLFNFHINKGEYLNVVFISEIFPMFHNNAASFITQHTAVHKSPGSVP